MRRVFSFFILASVLFVNNESARILAYFPTPSISHQIVFRPLIHELVKRGHEIVVITTDPAFPKGQTPANLTEINVHDMSYKLWKDTFVAASSNRNSDIFEQMKVGYEAHTKLFKQQMETSEVQEILNDSNNKFDLLIFEALSRPALALTHVYKVPLIQISSFGAVYGNYESVGAPVHPILYPTVFRQRIYNLTFWEKVTELYDHYRSLRWYHWFEANDNEVVRNLFGADVPDLSELRNNVDLIFFNVNPIWEGNRPVPPNVVYTGGLHQQPIKELPKDLKAYLDASTNGVIFISFGTNVSPSQLPQEKIQIMIKVFSQLPFNVLWKWDKDELPGRSDNIQISKWYPQSDLLRHPNVKLFITQGGLQSTDEAITAGVPLIGMPMIGDQRFNVEKYTYHKIGRRVDIDTITEEQFKGAIKDVVGDGSYRQNILRLRSLMHDQELSRSPLERAIWWTEYVLRHGGAKHLRSPSANITWVEYLELELVLYLLALVTSVISLLVFIVYKLVFSASGKLKTS